MYKLLVFFACWLTAVQGDGVGVGVGGPIRSYAYSYATPDGRQSRFEQLTRGSLNGGYKYKTPEGAVVAVRYSNDERASSDSFVQHVASGRSYRRLYDKGTSAVRAYRVQPKQSYAFSYATPDGQSRYESNESGAVKGGYQYTAPDGTVVKVRYIADENGFRTLGDGFVDHGPKAGTARSAYSYSYSGLSLPKSVLSVRPHVAVTAAAAQRHVQQPLTYYYYTPPATAYYVRKVDDDGDDDDHDDDDHDDDDDRKLVYYHGLPVAYQATQRYALPVAYAHQYPLPVTYPQQYHTARVAQVPLVNYGYVISH